MSLVTQQEMYKLLHKKMSASTKSILALQSLVQDLKDSYKEFGEKLKNVALKFHQGITNDLEDDPDEIVFMNQVLSNYLLKMESEMNVFHGNLMNEVVEPLDLFVNNFRTTNRGIANKAKEIFLSADNYQKLVVQSFDNYQKLHRNSEKCKQKIEKTIMQIDKGSKSEEELQLASEKSIELIMYAEESFHVYKKTVEEANKQLESFDQEFRNFFDSFELNEESRVKYSCNTVSQMLKLISQLNQQQANTDKLHEEKMKELESRIVKSNKANIHSLITKQVEKTHGKCTLTKKYTVQIMETEKQNQNILDNRELLESEKLILEHFSENIILSGSNHQYHQELLKIIPNANQNENSKNNNSLVLSTVNKILNKHQAKYYFTEFMFQNLKNNNKKLHLVLSEEFYSDLLDVFKNIIIFIDKNDVAAPELIYRILQMSMKIAFQKNIQSNKTQLIQGLKEINYWNKKEKWRSLFEFIKENKIQEKKLALGKKDSRQGKIAKISKEVKFFLNLGQKDEYISEEEEQQIEQQALYSIMEEINLFLINLELKSELTSLIIIELVSLYKKKINPDLIVQLLQKQENQINNELRKSIGKKKKKDQSYLQDQQCKIIFILNHCLPYLSEQDQPHNLRLVSKSINQGLKNSINKFYLLGNWHSNEKNSNKRMNYIINIFKLKQSNIDYLQLKCDVALNMDLNNNIEEVIQLDVQRSLNIHQDKISSSILSALLRTYALYNPVVQYCQGMNYIAGYLYLVLRNEQLTYRLFDKVMEIYFTPVFINEFALLKQFFYQFERIMSIHVTEFSEHLKNEKIDTNYFVPSWFITMFSCVFQYFKQSALLNIFWDIFLIQGWKGFYKCAIYLLKIFQQQLMNQEFDEVLHFLSDLTKHKIFSFDDEELLIQYIQSVKPQNEFKSVKKEIMKLKITNSLLKNLQNEYECFILKVNQTLKQLKK